MDFNFKIEEDESEGNAKGDGVNHLDGLKRYLKQNSIVRTGMDERIREERKRIGIDSEDRREVSLF